MSSAVAAIALFYFYVVASVCALALLLACEAVLAAVGARFGFAFVFVNLMKRHAPLIGLFVRSLLLPKSAEFRITLTPADAPRLFACVDRLVARLQIAPPDEIWIEMNAGAWVRLKGFRTGAGKTILGIGYDLLAVLSEDEVEAVLAHEMVHAKLVQRGIKQWLGGGLGRAASLSSRLGALVEGYRGAKEPFHLVGWLFAGARGLTHLAARLFAAYSRQDEFEADRGAAALCGSGPLRTSLVKLEAAAEKIGRLPWRERVAQMETSESFSIWLAAELAPDLAAQARATTAEPRDPFSTHPSLQDRIAALPDDNRLAGGSGAGILLLERPDRVAADLMVEIQAVTAREEQDDTKSLARWARKGRNRGGTLLTQWLGVASCLLGIAIVAMLFDEAAWEYMLGAPLFMGIGIWLIVHGRYRDKRVLPVPQFGVLKRAWQAEPPAGLAEAEKALEIKLQAMLGRIANKKGKVATATDVCFAALEKCEYLRAFVAARLALALDDKAVEAALGYSIACAGIGGAESAIRVLDFVQQKSGLKTATTGWGGAWAYVLAGDWSRAEALLWQAHERQQENPTLCALLGLAQFQRGKLQSAVLNVAKAHALEPAENEHAKLLANILLSGGRLREAEKHLLHLISATVNDREVAQLMVRLRLARRDAADARQWGERLRAVAQHDHSLVWLGEVFEGARQDQIAAEYYENAIAAHFYPEAHLGMARLAMIRRDQEKARQHLLAALNLERTVGPKGRTPVELFLPIVGQLSLLEEVQAGCAAWVASFPPEFKPAPLAGVSLMLYAPQQDVAEKHLDTVLHAMTPSIPPRSTRALGWKPAQRGQHPARPVRPGIQFAL